jgi:hypothetical protein
MQTDDASCYFIAALFFVLSVIVLRPFLFVCSSVVIRINSYVYLLPGVIHERAWPSIRDRHELSVFVSDGGPGAFVNEFR